MQPRLMMSGCAIFILVLSANSRAATTVRTKISSSTKPETVTCRLGASLAKLAPFLWQQVWNQQSDADGHYQCQHNFIAFERCVFSKVDND